MRHQNAESTRQRNPCSILGRRAREMYGLMHPGLIRLQRFTARAFASRLDSRSSGSIVSPPERRRSTSPSGVARRVAAYSGHDTGAVAGGSDAPVSVPRAAAGPSCGPPVQRASRPMERGLDDPPRCSGRVLPARGSRAGAAARCSPARREAVGAAFEDPFAGRIGNFGVFKWRLAIAVKGDDVASSTRLAELRDPRANSRARLKARPALLTG